ncbi:hypothetical protein HOK51_01305 [Candidatus Woesearchaeota archaeon]|jgi:hypothetical protein|nr:hypothetical protein [Candidatus Woesearchaeota archaeon]MBT6518451.1 hypothetical protein [Candidatus Woesearchaeota archaeon]MBT7366932.1 hypothetical protein [Candidatus Woesearchaeota archaeon]
MGYKMSESELSTKIFFGAVGAVVVGGGLLWLVNGGGNIMPDKKDSKESAKQEQKKNQTKKKKPVVIPKPVDPYADEEVDTLTATIFDSQYRSIAYRSPDSKSMIDIVPVTYVFAKADDGQHTFVYLSNKPVPKGVAEIAFVPDEDGEIQPNEIVNRYVGKKFRATNSTEPLEAEGIVKLIEYNF